MYFKSTLERNREVVPNSIQATDSSVPGSLVDDPAQQKEIHLPSTLAAGPEKYRTPGCLPFGSVALVREPQS